jgi:hypothetical protein
MAVFHFLLPPVLGGIYGKETDQVVGVGVDVIGDVLVVDPQTRETGLAAEDDGFVAVLRALAVGFVGDA